MKSVVIFAASQLAKEVSVFLKEYCPNVRVKYILDNNKDVKKFIDIEVFHPNSLDLYAYPILVASSHYNEIRDQLISNGLVENVNFYNAKALVVAKQELDKCSEVIRQFEKYGINYHLVKRKDFQHLKRSNKLFIFGTGASTNEFTKKQWEHIEEHDSWGLNLFNAHQFKPTFYSTEFVYYNLDKFDILMHNVKIRDEYPLNYIKDLPSSDKGYYKYLKENFESVPITLDIRLHTLDEVDFKNMLHTIRELGLQDIFNSCGIHLGGVTSVTTVMFHAVILGYEEIILCGVDLDNDIHFYESSVINVFNDDLTKYPIRKADEIGDKHPVLGEVYAIRADKAIYMIDEVILKENGINLKVASKNSALYPKLALYFN